MKRPNATTGIRRLATPYPCGCALADALHIELLCYTVARYAVSYTGITMPVCATCAQDLVVAYTDGTLQRTLARGAGARRLAALSRCRCAHSQAAYIDQACRNPAQYAWNYAGIVVLPVCRACAQDLVAAYTDATTTAPVVRREGNQDAPAQ